jgi:hypothetical protein
VAQKSEKLITAAVFAPSLGHKSNTPWPPRTRWPSQDHHCLSFFGSIGSWWNGFAGYSWVIWPLKGKIVAQKSEKLTPQIQHSMTTTDQMTISGSLFLHEKAFWCETRYELILVAISESLFPFISDMNPYLSSIGFISEIILFCIHYCIFIFKALLN